MRDLAVGGDFVVPGSLLRAVTSRSGGPGGQNVNKLETRVTIELDLATLPIADDRRDRLRQRLGGRVNKAGVLRVTSQAERSQLANRDRALSRMEELLSDALSEQEPRRATRTPNGEKRKRVEAKKRRGEQKRLRSTLD